MSKQKFTRSNILEIIQSGAGIDPRKANELSIRIIKTLADTLIAGDDVELRGLGTLEVKERKTYSARNPKTGEAVTVPSHRRVIFRPGRELKAALKNKK